MNACYYSKVWYIALYCSKLCFNTVQFSAVQCNILLWSFQFLLSKTSLHYIGLVHQFRINFMTRKKRRSTLPGIWGCHSLSWRRWRIFFNWFLAVSHVKVQFLETFCLIFVVQGYLTFVKISLLQHFYREISDYCCRNGLVTNCVNSNLLFTVISTDSHNAICFLLKNPANSSILWWNSSLCVRL